MIEALYDILEAVGYTHPLHPAVIHMPVGLTLGGFIFLVYGMMFKRADVLRASWYCAFSALVWAVPAAVFGYADWRRYYAGAWLPPVMAKLLLAPLLAVCLGVTAYLGPKKENSIRFSAGMYAACCMLVIGLGFFGAELVYGRYDRTPVEPPRGIRRPDAGPVSQGAGLFSQKCSACHRTDSNETLIGPGLKGLFFLERLPVSGRPVTPDTVESQIRTPYRDMPAFSDLTAGQIDALVAYIQSL